MSVVFAVAEGDLSTAGLGVMAFAVEVSAVGASAVGVSAVGVSAVGVSAVRAFAVGALPVVVLLAEGAFLAGPTADVASDTVAGAACCPDPDCRTEAGRCGGRGPAGA